MADSAVHAAQRIAMTGIRPLPEGYPEAPTCTVCDSPVMVDGLDVCWRHVEHALGITYRQLDYWTRQGHLKPKQDAPTSGAPRKWPLAELEIARRMARLTAAGIAVENAAAFARDSWPAGEIAPGLTLTATEDS